MTVLSWFVPRANILLDGSEPAARSAASEVVGCLGSRTDFLDGFVVTVATLWWSLDVRIYRLASVTHEKPES
jgi:hypothetical protein